MPTFDLDENHATYQIRSYKPGSIRVNDTLYTHSIIIAPDLLIDPWAPQQINELTPLHLSIITDHRPAILLIGTGEKLVFPAMEVYGNLINSGIGVEIMDTSAACRTFNALAAENRSVMAALIIR